MRTTSARVRMILGILAPLLLGTPGWAATPSLSEVAHVVVIYMENHSFDNRFGGWESVDGLTGTYIPQVDQQGIPYSCLPQQANGWLQSPPLPASCSDPSRNITSAFLNAPFNAADYQSCKLDKSKNCQSIPVTHEFYQEQYQIHGGLMDRFVIGNKTTGNAVNFMDTKTLPIYELLHDPSQPIGYAVLDHFFHAAFGGSFLNHQWLVAARTPIWVHAPNDGGPNDLHSVVDSEGMPNTAKKSDGTDYLYRTTATYALQDGNLTVSCHPAPHRGPTPPGIPCGDYAVNTLQPGQQPHKPNTKKNEHLPLLTTPTIGDELNDRQIDWAWYAAGWSNANGDIDKPGWTNGTPEQLAKEPKCYRYVGPFPFCAWSRFQMHHQPFNYYKSFDRNTDKGKKNRNDHLKDLVEFRQHLKQSSADCKLKSVSFIKPYLNDAEHSLGGLDIKGNQWLAYLVGELVQSACYKDSLIIVTYDENGGEYDHVSPPSKTNPTGPSDEWGPGTRVPTLVISGLLPTGGLVDHTSYDTTSILRTLEEMYAMPPLSQRDARVNSLGKVFSNAVPLTH